MRLPSGENATQYIGFSPLKVDGDVDSIDFAPCGNKFAIACNNYLSSSYSVQIFSQDGSTGNFACQSTLRGHNNVVSSLAFKPDDPNVLVTGSWDKTVKLWDLSTSTCLSTMRGHTDPVSSVCFSPDGAKIVSGSWDEKVLIWDAASGEQLCSLNVDAGFYGVLSISFAPKGDMVAAGCSNGKIFFVDPTAGEIKSSLTGHTHTVTGVYFDPTGKKIVSCSRDKTIRFWDSATGAAIGSPVNVGYAPFSLDVGAVFNQI